MTRPAARRGRPPHKPAITTETFIRVGEALFGDSWQTPLARALGLSARHVRLLAAGGAAVSAEITRRLAAICFLHGRKLIDLASVLEEKGSRS